MGERASAAARNTKENLKKPLALLALGGVTLLAAGCGSNETHTLKDATRIANERYARVYRNSSPVGKFALEYLRRGFTDVVSERDDGDNGGGITAMYRFQFNDGCLGGSAYDVAGGDFHIRVSASSVGLFSASEASGTASGQVPAAIASAYVSDKHPNVLRIEAGKPHTPPLLFSGVQFNDGLGLAPMDKYTENVLVTYGCDEGLEGYSVIKFDDGGVDDNVVHRELFLK